MRTLSVAPDPARAPPWSVTDTPGMRRDPALPRSRPLVGILVFDGVEVLDFAGPYEVCSGTLAPDRQPYVDVVTIGHAGEVVCRGGLRILPHHTVLDCPPLDALIVPGGPGADDPTPVQSSHLLPFLRERAPVTPTVASVCTGAFLLGRAGLLDGRRATTHSGALERLRAEFPAVQVVAEKVVDEGAIVTAAGVSSGIDLALHLLDRWFGAEARGRAARGLDGPWS
jgi:transcriptional regulator GlxA family with amidase domain